MLIITLDIATQLNSAIKLYFYTILMFVNIQLSDKLYF